MLADSDPDIHREIISDARVWIPAFAGMTEREAKKNPPALLRSGFYMASPRGVEPLLPP